MPSSRLAPTNLVLSLHSNTSATIDQLVLSLHSNTSATTDKSATTDSFCGFDRCGYYRITFSFLRTIFPSWTLPLRLQPHHVVLFENNFPPVNFAIAATSTSRFPFREQFSPMDFAIAATVTLRSPFREQFISESASKKKVHPSGNLDPCLLYTSDAADE